MEKETKIIKLEDGVYQLLLDGEMVKAHFNSKGAAQAAIAVERKRRFDKKMETISIPANARKVLQKHYASVLNGREITDQEIEAEIKSIYRRKEKGLLDCFYERLAAEMNIL